MSYSWSPASELPSLSPLFRVVAAHVMPAHAAAVGDLWGWECSCHKAAVCTLLLDAEWGLWLHRVSVSGTATADELAGVAS